MTKGTQFRIESTYIVSLKQFMYWYINRTSPYNHELLYTIRPLHFRQEHL